MSTPSCLAFLHADWNSQLELIFLTPKTTGIMDVLVKIGHKLVDTCGYWYLGSLLQCWIELYPERHSCSLLYIILKYYVIYIYIIYIMFGFTDTIDHISYLLYYAASRLFLVLYILLLVCILFHHCGRPMIRCLLSRHWDYMIGCLVKSSAKFITPKYFNNSGYLWLW